ncbi:MAG: hypothetical protein IJP31_07150 [Lachnospiraceae bacterium]|nr:hypothetical protein [Lachnospiraceae bacterium]
MRKRLISTGLLLLLLFLLLEYSSVSTGKEERGDRETKESQEVEVEEKDGSVGKADEEKKGAYEQETIQEIVEKNSPEKKEDTKAHYPETSKEAFLELVETETGEPICDIFYEDFEGNGEYSAFIFTGEKKEEGSDIEFTGNLWYACREGIMLVEEGIETSIYNPTVLTWGKEKHLLLVRAVDYTESLFWRVEKSYPLLIESLGAYCYSSGEELVAVYSFRSMSVGGRIWQDYYLYWDEQEQCYQEYSGKQISETEFLAYENAWQLQEEIEQVLLAGYKERMPESIRHEYIHRENGVVNIQFYFEWEEDTDYYYAILREDGKDGLKMDENYSPDMYQEQGFIQEEGAELLRLQKRPKKEEQEGTDSENKLVMVKEDDSCQIKVEKQQADARKNETKEWEDGYLSAYEDYILNQDQDPGEEFPIKGYCLVDLNFDLVPELGVYHDSMGSMGAWFAYYGFDGKEVVPLFQTSVYTQILADPGEQEVFLFREMYLLSGNDNGLIGYVSRLKQENGMITYAPILSLSVDEGRVIEAWNKGKELPDYSTEDEYLADETMNKYIFTEYWDQDGWQEISLAEYLERKRELIPDENKLVDLTEGEACLLAKEQEDDEDKLYSWENWIPEEEKIHRLFEEWQKKQEKTAHN